MHKNVVFDMGGVLLDFSEARVLEHYFGHMPEEEQALVRDAVFRSGAWRRYDRGDFDEADTAREICAKLPDEYHAGVTRLVFNYFEAMPPLPTNALIPALKARDKKVYLLTNAPRVFHREKHRIPHLELFDGIFASCDVGLLKPDEEIYLQFLREFSLEARDCIFIDDMRVNIEGAEKVGIQGFCFEDKDLPALRKALEVD